MEIYVGNLSYQTQEDALRKAFEAFGPVEKVSIVKDKFTGEPRGFAFVSMADWKAAQAAIKDLNGKEVDGRALVVNQARAREDRPQRRDDRRF